MSGVRQPSSLRRCIELFGLIALLLLCAQGLLNYLFAATPLVIWKQVLIPAVFGATLLIYRHRRDVGLSIAVVILGGELAVYTVLAGNPAEAAIYNAFYYIGWIPFYLLGTSIDLSRCRRLLSASAMIVLAVSAAGLLLQLFTGMFGFLEDGDAALYRSRFGETQRFGFLFVASTGVIPTLLGFYRLLSLAQSAMLPRIYGILALALSGVPTGSLSSLIGIVAALGSAFARMRPSARVLLFGAVVLGGAGLVTYGGDVVALQLARMTGNGIESVSNQGRIALWGQALEIIGGFNLENHLAGLGLGTTNGNYFGAARAVHGESTFFQAYIEGGIIGLALRVLPFVLLFRAALKLPDKSDDLFYGFALLVCCAVAPIFAMFGVSCMLGFIAGIAVSRARSLPAASKSAAQIIGGVPA